jgi:Tol biopolymer transport system component
MKKILFYFISLLLVFVSFYLLDYFVGLFQQTAIIKNNSYLFRNEVAPLQTTTNHLLPNLFDQFPDEFNSSKMRTIRTDEFGILQGPGVKNTTPNETILFLGGSTTENNEVREEYRFPYLAVAQLNKISGVNFVGVNAGVRAHTTQNSINLYLNHPSPEISNSKYVVMMHNINDRLKLALDGSYKSKLNHKSGLSFEYAKEKFLSSLHAFFLWAKGHSNILFILHEKVAPFFTKNQGVIINENILDQTTALTDDDIKNYRENLKIFIGIVKSQGKIPVLMTQPLGKSSQGQALFNETIRKVSLENSVFLIDLDRSSDSLKNKEKLFFGDGVHFNDQGSKWASDYIASSFTQIIGSKRERQKLSLGCKPIMSDGKDIVNQSLNQNLLEGRYPSLSSDGKYLLYQSYRDHETSIMILDVITGKSRVVIKKLGINTIEHPTWFDSDSIIYGEKTEDKSRLFLLDIKSGSSKPLFVNPDLLGSIANVSNKGEIAFAGYEYQDGRFTKPEIYYMKSNTSEPIKLTGGGYEKWRPFFNESEGTIYYIGAPYDGIFNLYKTSIDGVYSQLVYTENNRTHWDPAISLDGKKIAYAQKNDAEFDIFISELSGFKKNIKRLSYSSEDEWDPRFSPNGSLLLYAGTSIYGSQIRAICLK